MVEIEEVEAVAVAAYGLVGSERAVEQWSIGVIGVVAIVRVAGRETEGSVLPSSTTVNGL